MLLYVYIEGDNKVKLSRLVGNTDNQKKARMMSSHHVSMHNRAKKTRE